MWKLANTAPKNRSFIAKLLWVGDDNFDDVWVQYIGPVFWEIEIEDFTDSLGKKISGQKYKGCTSHFAHWAEIPENFSEAA